jgi:large repetitive protein
VASFTSYKLKFLDANTGYALTEQNIVQKTTDGGVIWEPLARDNNYSYLGYTHNDLFFWNLNQFWAGGQHRFLELSTNAGGIPLPKAYFSVDTSGYYKT